MRSTSKGSAGGLSFAGWPAPVPSSTQPADTSPGPERCVQRVPALAAAYGLQARPIEGDPYAAMAREIYLGDGPEFHDGCDHEGFAGGCVRFGHTPADVPEEARMKFGTLIRSKRKAMRLTLREAAKRMSVGFAYLCDVEHNKKMPTVYTLRKIQRFYNISNTQLWTSVVASVEVEVEQP